MKMDLKAIEYGCLDWIHLPQGWNHWRALVNTGMNLQVL
jgi:hypothetical protein